MSQDRFIQLAQLIAGVGGGLSGSLQPSISCPSLTHYLAVWFFFHSAARRERDGVSALRAIAGNLPICDLQRAIAVITTS